MADRTAERLTWKTRRCVRKSRRRQKRYVAFLAEWEATRARAVAMAADKPSPYLVALIAHVDAVRQRIMLPPPNPAERVGQ